MSGKGITNTQAEALRKMHAENSVLRRVPGGFWTTSATQFRKSIGGPVPEWWVTVGTIRALQRKGLIEKCGVDARDWADDRKLTRNGSELALVCHAMQNYPRKAV
jgi:DNA-binding HxlR family transcriptional regulator